jgi:hypothetical protein
MNIEEIEQALMMIRAEKKKADEQFRKCKCGSTIELQLIGIRLNSLEELEGDYLFMRDALNRKVLP